MRHFGTIVWGNRLVPGGRGEPPNVRRSGVPFPSAGPTWERIGPRPMPLFGFGITETYQQQCDLTAELDVLAVQLERAGALGLYNHSLAIAAQAVFDANRDLSTTSAAQCLAAKSAVRSMADKLYALNNEHLGPMFGPQVQPEMSLSPIDFDAPTAVPVLAAIGGVLAVGLLWWGLTR